MEKKALETDYPAPPVPEEAQEVTVPVADLKIVLRRLHILGLGLKRDGTVEAAYKRLNSCIAEKQC